jgi:hypothetical protein
MPTLDSAAMAALDDLDLDDLYADLALAEAGTEPDISMAMESLASIRTMMAADSAAAAISVGGLIRKGKRIFNKYWPIVRDAVCKLWKEHGEDWLDKAADVISAVLRLPKVIIALILKIAIKLGMAAICSDDAAPQPA